MSNGLRSKVRDTMAAHIAQGHLPGAAWLVGRGRDVHADAIGERRVGGLEPMTRDTIFRIASMTKPMVAAVAMMLVASW
jgi:CubicO group peptidase (beta-lactamase class C family)